MLKMMLVDGDFSVISELYRLCHWQKEEQIKIVAAASSFEDAFRKYQEKKPDIVLTEFRIGEETASEWWERIRKISEQETEFVVLTSGTEFCDVKAAYESGAAGYLLKPVQAEELLQTLRRLCLKLEEKREKQHALKNYYDDLPKLQNLFLQELAQGKQTNSAEWKEKSLLYGIELPKVHYRMLFFDGSEEVKTEELRLFAEKTEAYLRSCEGCCAHLFDSGDMHPTILLGGEWESREEIRLLLNGIFFNCAGKNNVFGEPFEGICLGISESFREFSQAHTAYEQARSAAEERRFLSEHPLLFYETGEIKRGYDLPVRLAIDVIHSRYEQTLTIEQVAAEVFVSASYLMHIFKKNTGMTFHEYLTDYRIKTAIGLMKNKKYRFYEIGEMVGYHNANSFRQAFKKVTGRSPKDYRNKE